MQLAVLKGGEKVQAHDKSVCTPPCAIHSPSDHRLADWPQHWRNDRGFMERICPHGVGHPDPDHMAYLYKTMPRDKAKAEGIHGCDGCCRKLSVTAPPKKKTNDSLSKGRPVVGSKTGQKKS